MKIIERIFDVMDKKHLKIIELADFLSINSSVVSTWKKRNTNPPSEYIIRICEFLDVSIEYLLTGKESSNNLTTDEEYILRLYRKLNFRNKIKIEAILEEKLSQEDEELKKTCKQNPINQTICQS